MNVLVTGGAGYIGSFVAAGLVMHGHSTVVIDNLSSGKRESLHDDVCFHEGDIGERGFLDSVFSRESIDIVMHCAAATSVDESLKNPGLYYTNNVVGTIVLLDAMRRHGVGNIVFSSTAAVYGEPEYQPVDENHKTDPVSPYGTSKRMAEEILRDYQKAYGISCIILRYFNVAGASFDGLRGESQGVKKNLIPIVLENLEKGRMSTICGADWETDDGTCIRDYVHVEDIASAHLLAAELLNFGAGFEIVNLGSEKGASVREVIDAICRVSGNEVRVQYGNRRPGDVARLVASSVKAKKLLCWKPQHASLEAIVRSAYFWHFNRRY